MTASNTCGRSIDGEALVHEAQLITGLEDFGNGDWRPAYDALISSINAEADLHELGAVRTRLKLRDLLCGRLMMVADRKRYPQIADEQIRPPIVVVGFPRAGSTFLYNLLAQDPDHMSPKFWEIMFPSPPPGLRGEAVVADPRIAICHERLGDLGLFSKEIQQGHRFGAERAEECLFMWEYTFRSVQFWTYWNIPTYMREVVEPVDQKAVYEEQKRMLQHLQYGRPGRRWLLKTPAHDNHLEAFSAVFPESVFVWTHRDPAKVIASLDRIYAANHGPYSDRVVSTGEVALKTIAELLAAGTRFREKPGNESRFYDAHFTAVQRDPLATVEAIYERFSIDFPAPRRAILAEWLSRDQARQKKTGTHKYSLDEAGLSQGTIDSIFGEYIRKYNIEIE